MSELTDEIKRIAEELGVDLNAPLPDFSNPELIRELCNRFTDDCSEELAAQHRAEEESMANAWSVAVWG